MFNQVKHEVSVSAASEVASLEEVVQDAILEQTTNRDLSRGFVRCQ